MPRNTLHARLRDYARLNLKEEADGRGGRQGLGRLGNSEVAWESIGRAAGR